MADAVVTTVLNSDPRIYAVHLTNICDGTGESAVVKVDRSTLLTSAGAEPNRLVIRSCRWAVQGFTSVRILWDAATDDVAMLLTNNGYDNFTSVGGLRDPRSTTNVGDILLTTNGNVSGATYDITLVLELRGT